MFRRNHFTVTFIFFIMLLFTFCESEREGVEAVSSSGYDDLISLFKEFREFQKPKVTAGIPDYTPTAMKEQWKGLKKFQDRVATFNIRSWPVSQQVDYHIVRVEMNGLEFMDEFFAAGMIPISLIRWEMTGLEDEIKMLR